MLREYSRWLRAEAVSIRKPQRGGAAATPRRRQQHPMSPGQPVLPGELRGGHLLSAISNGIVKLMREHYGRGPMKAKTYVLDDIVVCVLRGSGFTPLEHTIMASDDHDRGERVIAMREDFQRMMAGRYQAMIEQLTGRKVLAFLSQAHVEPDITLEMFFVDPPLQGFGAADLLDGQTVSGGPASCGQHPAHAVMTGG